jgi:hypothetical protein
VKEQNVKALTDIQPEASKLANGTTNDEVRMLAELVSDLCDCLQRETDDRKWLCNRVGSLENKKNGMGP